MTARPAWLDRVAATVGDAPPEYFSRFAPPQQPRRRSAVLMLFGPRSYAVPPGPAAPSALPGASRAAGASGSAGAATAGSAIVAGVPDHDVRGVREDRDELTAIDVVLTERAASLRSHAGQVSFPGGGVDPGDDGPVAAALRESQEEVGVDPASVDVVAALPPLYLTPSANSVVPVLGWWPRPSPVAVVDPAEVARVERVAVGDLLDPANRFCVESPRGGWVGPAFEVDGLFVWGFTAMLLDVLFDTAGLTRPWNRSLRRPIPPGVAQFEPTPPDDDDDDPSDSDGPDGPDGVGREGDPHANATAAAPLGPAGGEGDAGPSTWHTGSSAPGRSGR